MVNQTISPTPFAADSGFAAEGMRREPAELSVGEGVLPAPPLPLKPTVGRIDYGMSTLVYLIAFVVTIILAMLVRMLIRWVMYIMSPSYGIKTEKKGEIQIGGDVTNSTIIAGNNNAVLQKKYKISVAHPKLLSKGYVSLFIVQIYLPQMRSLAKKTLTTGFQNQKITEHLQDASIKEGTVVKIQLSSPVLRFSDSLCKDISQFPIIARFTAIPNNDCQPGIQYVVLSITDAETQIEYESVSFAVKVADFAFDHISRPLFSKIVSVALGLGSLIMFVLTALEQIDKTFGLTAGTAAAVLTSTLLLRLWLFFKHPKATHAL